MNEIEKKAELLSARLFQSTAEKRKELILQFASEVAQAQRNRDRAVYSINRTKTSIEIKALTQFCKCIEPPPDDSPDEIITICGRCNKIVN